MTDRFAHHGPFGARVLEDGRTRFRFWAPAQKAPRLALEDTGAVLPMTAEDGGWFAAETDAGAGSLYRFALDDGTRVPDPASRFQPEDVNGASLVVNPTDHAWRNPGWRGRPWHEAVVYELHVGAFTAQSSYAGVGEELGRLRDLGVTAVQLMPLNEVRGRRNWGYDGVLPYAPESGYGLPDDLKRLIDSAHDHELMVFLDVVYNHFGPDGNYLNLYAPDMFDDTKPTPWGAAINLKLRPVRDFFIHNALTWLNEYRFDGLRFDAVHALIDPESDTHFLDEMAETIRRETGGRHVHLILENEENDVRRLERGPDGRPVHYTAQWNDDVHHVAHVLASGETESYYEPYAERPLHKLLKALTTGFVFQGDPFAVWDGEPRGAPSGHLPPGAFVNFLQNHDQIGNRALGERLEHVSPPHAIAALQALVYLAPQPPMLFMGEEYAAPEPFLFFTDFDDDLGEKVKEGRRGEFKKFAAFNDPEKREKIPDPNAAATFERSRLDPKRRVEPKHAAAEKRTGELLRLRAERIAPRLEGMRDGAAEGEVFDGTGLHVAWRLPGGGRLAVTANLGAEPIEGRGDEPGEVVFVTHEGVGDGRLPPWSVAWRLEG